MIGIGTCPGIAFALFANKAKPSIAGLTAVAALPQAGGCMATLPAEVWKPKEAETYTWWQRCDSADWTPSVQMKAPYFDWEAETPLPAIDLGLLDAFK